ncbi:MAG: hypothetical protein L6Q47_14030 [Ignavibacteriaceae bacterium]|nr:hypothetical protein [Ignavibacteriaceae bacterium]
MSNQDHDQQNLRQPGKKAPVSLIDTILSLPPLLIIVEIILISVFLYYFFFF